MKITKRFKWVMGHRLTFHQGGCYNIHGHNYECKISVEGYLENNMVIDFGELSKLFQELVHNPWDHSFLVYEEDNFRELLLMWSKDRPFKIALFPVETTAENIAKYLFDIFSQKINNERIRVTRVKVYETPTSEAACYE